MFKLNPNPTFPASVEIPAHGGGDGQKLNLVFKHKTRDELADYRARAMEADGTDQVLALVMEVVDGWEDVDGEFSEAAMRKLLQNYVGAQQWIHERYLDAMDCSRRGN